MSVANVISEINAAKAAGIPTVPDFDPEGIKTDVIAESTSGSGVTVSNQLVKSGGDKTVMISVPDGAAYTVLALARSLTSR